MSVPSYSDRKDAATAAKKAMLEKFKAKAAAPVDPKIAEEQAARLREREEKRAQSEARRKERLETERLERQLAAEAKAKADAEDQKRRLREAEKRRRAEAEAAEIRAFEEQAKRDLAKASLKLRKKA
jgi:hypothetical protein